MTAFALEAVRGRGLVRSLRANPLLLVGILLAAALVLVALLAPLLAPDPADAGSATHPLVSLLGPSWSHPFGTDAVGRDVLSRVLYGARISLSIAGVVIVGSLLIGVPIGLVAGYFGGIGKSVV